MKRTILSKVAWARNILAKDNHSLRELDEALSDLNRWISYFQHERHMHLIVMIAFAFLTIFAVILTFLVKLYIWKLDILGLNYSSVFYLSILIVLLLAALLIAYIRHYFVLENNTQLLYKLYDEMLDKRRKIER